MTFILPPRMYSAAFSIRFLRKTSECSLSRLFGENAAQIKSAATDFGGQHFERGRIFEIARDEEAGAVHAFAVGAQMAMAKEFLGLFRREEGLREDFQKRVRGYPDVASGGRRGPGATNCTRVLSSEAGIGSTSR